MTGAIVVVPCWRSSPCMRADPVFCRHSRGWCRGNFTAGRLVRYRSLRVGGSRDETQLTLSLGS